MKKGLARNFFRQSVVQVAAINALSGVGFAGANLVLAWTLPTDQYGLIALVVALTNIGIAVGPLGLTGVVNRRLVRADSRLMIYGLAASITTAVGVSVLGIAVYDLSTSIIIAMCSAIMAGSMTLIAAAKFQNMQRFVIANCLTQFGNLGLAATSVIVLAIRSDSPLLPLYLVALAALATAIWSWGYLFRHPDQSAPRIRYYDWSDAISMVGMVAASVVLLQLERLLIPDFLTLGDLAIFGVMAAIVVAPYRSLELAVSFTLIPRLRAIDNTRMRRRLITNETLFVLGLSATGAILIYLVAPYMVEWIYGDRYPISKALIVAGLLGGIIKVLSSVARSAAVAYCSTRELWVLSWFAWLSVAAGALGAYFGSAWGVTGVVYGVTSGFVVRGFASSWIAYRYYL